MLGLQLLPRFLRIVILRIVLLHLLLLLYLLQILDILVLLNLLSFFHMNHFLDFLFLRQGGINQFIIGYFYAKLQISVLRVSPYIILSYLHRNFRIRLQFAFIYHLLLLDRQSLVIMLAILVQGEMLPSYYRGWVEIGYRLLKLLCY